MKAYKLNLNVPRESIFPLAFGLIVVLLILGIIFLPQVTSALILAVLIYWVYKTVSLIVFSLKHYTEIQINESLDWKAKYLGLEDLEAYKKNIIKSIKTLEKFFNERPSLINRLLIRFSRKSRIYSSYLTKKRELVEISKINTKDILKPSNIYNLLIIPQYKESFETIKPVLDSISQQKYNLENLFVVLASEERDPEREVLFERIKGHYTNIPNLYMTIHSLTGEEKAGKGTNCRSSVIEFEKELKARGIENKDVIVTITDADVVFNHNYFACLTYNYCISENRYSTLFHATPLFTYNYKEIHGFSRVIGTLNTLDTLRQIGNKYTHPQSTYSLSLNSLFKIGLWDKDVMSEDENIYKKMFLHYKEKFTLSPLFIEIFMSMPNADEYISSVKTVYDQMQRWIYGALIINKDMLFEFTRNPNLSTKDRIRTSFDSLERTILWPFYSFFLVFGITIIQLARTSFTSDKFIAISHVLTVTITIVNILLIGIITLLDYYIRQNNEFSKLSLTGEIYNMRRWLYFPIISIFLGFIPYIDANLRIVLRKNLSYKVSKKNTKL